jgi:folate-binding protein YgfZ
MATARLTDRGVVEVSGDEARSFLDRLVTCDLDRVSFGTARYGALLSPQGKILADFIVVQADEPGTRFLLDCPASCAGDLVRRLSLYKLRAKVSVGDGSAAAAILAGWNAPQPSEGVSVPDPRLPALGWRAIVAPSSAVAGGEAEYHAHRVGLGVPEAGRDFALGDAFPHEALLDQMAGVDFDKGCYVGQEVVSRMQHRGTARTRIVSLGWSGAAGPETGSEVMAGDRALGRVGSVAGQRALAMIRLDRAADALAAGETIRAGDAELAFAKPDWIRFAYPAELMAPAA